MRTRRLGLFGSLALAGLLWVGPASALGPIPVGPAPSLTGESESHGGFHSSHPFLGAGGWCVAISCDPPEPFTVIADPGAAVWIKDLLPPDGQTAPIPFSTQFVVLEWLRVGPGPAWRDWHEEILTPGWDWIDGSVSVGVIGSDLVTAPGLEVSLSPDRRTIWFDFDAVAPGTDFVVWKVIHCNNEQFGCLPQPIQIAEYPTIPEPASLLLLGAGLAGLVWWRRRASA